VGLRPLACWDCWFESRQGHGCLSPVSVVCSQVEVSAPGWSVAWRSPAECGVSECDREVTVMRPWPTKRCCDIGKKNLANCLPSCVASQLAKLLSQSLCTSLTARSTVLRRTLFLDWLPYNSSLFMKPGFSEHGLRPDSYAATLFCQTQTPVPLYSATSWSVSRMPVIESPKLRRSEPVRMPTVLMPVT
jgi:hypothetical protein